MYDFTIKMYRTMCLAIKNAGYTNSTISNYLQHPSENIILLRHDVDRFPKSALKIAEVEHSVGLKSTFYFRYTKSVFNTRIIKGIRELGHEVGYHYETLAKARGDQILAKDIFLSELAKFREVTPVKTASMHGRPFSKYDNRDIWKSFSREDLGILGEAYLDLDYNKIRYFTDTGRTWHGGKYNVRDRVPTYQKFGEIETTQELIQLIKNRSYRDICILTHPNRWTDSLIGWCKSYSSDFIINQIKRGLIYIRK